MVPANEKALPGGRNLRRAEAKTDFVLRRRSTFIDHLGNLAAGEQTEPRKLPPAIIALHPDHEEG